jgi:aryl-alcohol dehydrogenase-like predicted oxidoreductase
MTLQRIFRSRWGSGAAPLGTMFRAIPEAEALASVRAAWRDGIRRFDRAPFYGAGLAELHMGEALADVPRGDYVIGTKVGRIILDGIEDVSITLRPASAVSDAKASGRAGIGQTQIPPLHAARQWDAWADAPHPRSGA